MMPGRFFREEMCGQRQREMAIGPVKAVTFVVLLLRRRTRRRARS